MFHPIPVIRVDSKAWVNELKLTGFRRDHG